MDKKVMELERWWWWWRWWWRAGGRGGRQTDRQGREREKMKKGKKSVEELIDF